MIKDVIIQRVGEILMGGELAVIEDVQIIVPALFAPDRRTWKLFLTFFAASLRTKNTRKAYIRAATSFALWCEKAEIPSLQDIEPLHIATYVAVLQTRLSDPSVKQHLAALKRLFDWLVVNQVIAVNPASPVRGPAHSVKKGKTQVLSA